MRATLGPLGQTIVGLAIVSMVSLAIAEESKTSSTKLKSAGALAFGPGGVLFVADAKSAAIFAIETDDRPKATMTPKDLSGIDAKIAAALGAKADGISINDMAVNRNSGAVYFSVSRGLGADAAPVVIRVSPGGEISEVATEGKGVTKGELPNPPADKVVQRGRRKSNPRLESITDIEYQDGKVLVAGLSNEEFASTFRTIPYPFKEVGKGASVEIYHASHGRYETNAPIRAFTTYNIGDEPHVLAGYTCTPLVKIPVNELKSGNKIRGVTLAELGNRNRPLDMFVYKKNGEDFVLMSNSARGLMKINTKDMSRQTGLTERVRDKAGQEYETIEGYEGVVQLSQLSDNQAVALIKSGSQHDLKVIDLP